jgi:hypothetical protein
MDNRKSSKQCTTFKLICPELGVGRIVLLKIPCYCDECQVQAKIQWEPSVKNLEDQP